MINYKGNYLASMGIVCKLTFYCYSDSSFRIYFPLQCVPGMSRDIYDVYLKDAKGRRRHIDKRIKGPATLS